MRSFGWMWMIAALCVLLPAARARCGSDERGLLPEYRLMRAVEGSFIVQYPPRIEPMAREVVALLEESAGDIADDLGLETIAPIRVYVVGDEPTYRALHAGAIPEWSAAFSDIGDQVLGILAPSVVSGPRTLRVTIRHELSHLLLAQRVGAVHVPTWFMEGLAMMQAGEWRFTDEWNFMLLVGRRRLPYLEELSGPFPRRAEDAALAYGLSYVAVRSLFKDRADMLPTFTAFMRDRGDFEDAFVLTFGTTPYIFAARLYVNVDERYKKPGTILNGGPYWIALAGFFVAVFIMKRMRMRRRLREMEERDSARARFFG